MSGRRRLVRGERPRAVKVARIYLRASAIHAEKRRSHFSVRYFGFRRTLRLQSAIDEPIAFATLLARYKLQSKDELVTQYGVLKAAEQIEPCINYGGVYLLIAQRERDRRGINPPPHSHNIAIVAPTSTYARCAIHCGHFTLYEADLLCRGRYWNTATTHVGHIRFFQLNFEQDVVLQRFTSAEMGFADGLW